MSSDAVGRTPPVAGEVYRDNDSMKLFRVLHVIDSNSAWGVSDDDAAWWIDGVPDFRIVVVERCEPRCTVWMPLAAWYAETTKTVTVQMFERIDPQPQPERRNG